LRCHLPFGQPDPGLPSKRLDGYDLDAGDARIGRPPLDRRLGRVVGIDADRSRREILEDGGRFGYLGLVEHLEDHGAELVAVLWAL